MLSLLFSDPLLFLVWLLAILVALSLHEFAHALAAHALGDETAKRLGRLTLNPASHVDPMGLIALVTVGFGWGRPVPFNPYNLRNQRWGPTAVAFAGPIMNLVVAAVCAFIFRLVALPLGPNNLLVQFLLLCLKLNLALLLFNLIPLPPLDGSKFLLSVLEGPAYARARFVIETYGPWILLGIIIFDSWLGLGIFSVLSRAATAITRVLLGV